MLKYSCAKNGINIHFWHINEFPCLKLRIITVSISFYIDFMASLLAKPLSLMVLLNPINHYSKNSAGQESFHRA